MIVQCTIEEVTNLMNECRAEHVIYASIEKIDDDLIIKYTTIEDAEDKTEALKVIRSSSKEILNFIGALDELKEALKNNYIINNYRLELFEHNNTLSCSCNKTIINVKKPMERIDFETLFKSNLNDKVPGLYAKVSAKKYNQITYKELADILNK